MFGFLDPLLIGKILAVLAVLSSVKAALNAFGQDNKIIRLLGTVVDFFSSNLKH